MNILGSANKTHGTQTKSALVKSSMRGGHHVGMAAEAQVVVAAKIQDLGTVGQGYDRVLRRGDDAFALKKALLLDGL